MRTRLPSVAFIRACVSCVYTYVYTVHPPTVTRILETIIRYAD